MLYDYNRSNMTMQADASFNLLHTKPMMSRQIDEGIGDIFIDARLMTFDEEALNLPVSASLQTTG